MDKFVDWLQDRLSSVYCDTCKHIDNDDVCDYCNRKSMNWSISKSEAETIVERLIDMADSPCNNCEDHKEDKSSCDYCIYSRTL